MISKRAQAIVPSISGELTARANTMRKQGRDIIKLNIGEPDFKPPVHVREAMSAAALGNYSKYPPIPGYLDLREAICEKLKCDNGIQYQPSDIVVSTGAKQAVINSLMALCDPGDEVIIPTPCWVSYSEMVKLTGATPVFVPCYPETGFELNVEGIAQAITEHTKVIIICTPNNPSGAVYSEASLRRLAELAEAHDFYIISDEIYEKILYDDAKHFSIASISPAVKARTVTINGFSKAYAMPGWRLGYSAAEGEVAASIKSIQSHMTSGANAAAQRAAVAALTGSQIDLEQMRSEYQRRRDYACEVLSAIPGIELVKPQGAFYLYPKVSAYTGKSYGGTTINNSMDLAEYLLNEAEIAVVFGEAYFMEGYLRISYAVSMEELQEALRRFRCALEKLS